MISDIINEFKLWYFIRTGENAMRSYLRCLSALGVEFKHFKHAEQECRLLKKYRAVARYCRKHALKTRRILRHGGLFD